MLATLLGGFPVLRNGDTIGTGLKTSAVLTESGKAEMPGEGPCPKVYRNKRKVTFKSTRTTLKSILLPPKGGQNLKNER